MFEVPQRAEHLQERFFFAGARPHDDILCLQSLFEVQADSFPNAIAIEGDSVCLTYRQLEVQANQLAHLLRAYDIGPGKLVGLYYHRSAEPIIAILACLKAGAGYVPIDPITPPDRIHHILAEAGIELILTEKALAQKARSFFQGSCLPTDLLWDEISKQPATRLTSFDTGVSENDLCYVIYTSGTTGRPKGVMTEHGQAYRYVLAFNEVCATARADRIYQGFSLSFDGSIEEIWMAFSNGATLVVPSPSTAKFGNELAAYLVKYKVTYFSTVPTLLSTFSDDIPSLTQLVVSGEVCPANLVLRWARPGRSMFNVYGPTEATVNTTAALCTAGGPVTIGRPLRGYEIHILNENLKPVSYGEKGELFVGGSTLARGYLKQPELTSERFLTVQLAGVGQRRLYRTGDLVRWNEADELEFYGRIDGQVKIRGYRVELSEIEMVLLQHPGIRSATVRLCEVQGLQSLAAYVTLDDNCIVLDKNALLDHLHKQLPNYMVPSYLEILEEVPTLASGKVNRSLLPDPVSLFVRNERNVEHPSTDVERQIAALWKEVLGVSEVSVNDDFFKDLGGYSLLAAKMVTQIRERLSFDIAIRDAYQFPTIRRLAEHLTSQCAQKGEGERPTSHEVFQSVSKWERWTVHALQGLSIFGLYAVGTVFFSIIAYVINSILHAGLSIRVGCFLLLGMGMLSLPIGSVVAIAAKWILVGKLKPGAVPLWSFAYFRWWLVNKLQGLSGAGAIAGTPLMPLYYRLLGARVGKHCVMDTTMCGAWDLLSVGDESSISSDAQILCYRIEEGMLKFGAVEIGKRCFIGRHSTLGLNTSMADDCRLDSQSYLPDDAAMKPGESRNGSPALVSKVELPESEPGRVAWRRPLFWSIVFVGIFGFTWAFMLSYGLAWLGTLVAAFWLGGFWWGLTWLFASLPVGFVFYCLFCAVVRYLVMPKARTGVFPVDSWAYVQRWFFDGFMKANRTILKPLYTTLYLPLWLRIMGARIGRGAEISTVWYFSPELIELGAESFFADGCIIGGRRTYRGRCQVERNKIGRRSFVGNGANVPGGYIIGDQCLLGVLSSPPATTAHMPNETEWLGNPSFSLPNRKKNVSFSAAETFEPTFKLYAERALIDALRILIPTFLVTASIGVELTSLIFLYWELGLAWTLLLSPFVTVAVALFIIFSVIILKWMVMGRFKPTIKPLWCRYIWLNEMVNGAYETLFIPLVSLFAGTPFIAIFLRAIGVKVGKHCYIDEILFSEFDLIEIGDQVSLNSGSVLQTHLFEDRVFKSSTVKVGEGASIGNMSIVLYDTTMLPHSSLSSLSLLMKGETLAPHTSWHGIPTSQKT
ncbi:MAG: amino acid adenylation domain-containing protein [Deltaproteobacteria bacterium]|nr:amino acid adenylation domain-containing protein [Deltaproteobacteria bacterium]